MSIKTVSVLFGVIKNWPAEPKLKNVVSFVLDLIKHLDFIPQEYFKKLKGSDDILEVRVQYGNNIFRLLGFFEANNIVILNHAFTKKTQKTPTREINIAEKRKCEYLKERGLL